MLIKNDHASKSAVYADSKSDICKLSFFKISSTYTSLMLLLLVIVTSLSPLDTTNVFSTPHFIWN